MSWAIRSSELHRTRIGCLADIGLMPGSWRKLDAGEVEELRELIQRCSGEAATSQASSDTEPPGPPTPIPTAAFVVAIDGPAGSGKTSVARAVAERFGFAYFNTGASVRGGRAGRDAAGPGAR